MVRNILKILCVLALVGVAGPGFADVVRLTNGNDIKAPKVIDAHGLFGPADKTDMAVPQGKVRLVWENGYMDIPAKEIHYIKRE